MSVQLQLKASNVLKLSRCKQVVRKLAILFSSFLTYLILKKTVSKRVMISLAVASYCQNIPPLRNGGCILMYLQIIVLGFVFGSIGEVRLSWAGMILGTIASFCVALYGIYVKKTLPIVDEDQWFVLLLSILLICSHFLLHFLFRSISACLPVSLCLCLFFSLLSLIMRPTCEHICYR